MNDEHDNALDDKNALDKIKWFHRWSSYEVSGRPDQFLGSFVSRNEAQKVCGCGIAPEARAEWCRCVTIYDAEGDGVYNDEDGFLQFKRSDQ